MAYFNFTATDLNRMSDIEQVSLFFELCELFKASDLKRNQEIALILYRILSGLNHMHDKNLDLFQQLSEDQVWLTSWSRLSPALQLETSAQAQDVADRFAAIKAELDRWPEMSLLEGIRKDLDL